MALTGCLIDTQALGVDDGRLLVPLVLIPVFIAILFSNFASTQVTLHCTHDEFAEQTDRRTCDLALQNQRAQSAVEPDNITVLQFNCVWIS